MEISQEEVETIEVTNEKDVEEILKHAVSGDEVILDSENAAEGELEEIIEIIEEIEEEEVEDSEQEQEQEQRAESNSETQFTEESPIDSNDFEEQGYAVITKIGTQSNGKRISYNGVVENHGKNVVRYEVDEDWGEEDLEQFRNRDSQSNQGINLDKAKFEYRDSASNASENVQHEVVKNAENNLVYTVLGSKKQSNSAKPQIVKVEHLEEDSLPIEGTIYYEGENMETIYVAEPMDDSEQYQYDVNGADTAEQTDQDWEMSNQGSTTQGTEENEASQDQIFLHEDEDGQLYFKDENGMLQPVYLTSDGNYAIAEPQSDDQESQENQMQIVQNSNSPDPKNYMVPHMENHSDANNKLSSVAPSTSHDAENEDNNTVTISLIISEDEHGQKRTQVIIPTTDNLKCDICNKSFKTSFQLLRHNRLKHAREEDITTRNFPCDLCPKRYPDQNALARHRKTHTGDRPFQCLECHQGFPTATSLRRHLTLHNPSSRPLPCIYCGRRFAEKASLDKHEQAHLAGETRNHFCDICNKTFADANDLIMHKKYHDPDKKFDCKVCGREFNRLNNLQRHMLVHQHREQGAQQEILSCEVCGITYKFMSSLTRHMVTTHMNPEKLRQQAEEQRKKRENNYRRYLENRKMYETQPGHSGKRYSSSRNVTDNDNDDDDLL